MSDELLLSFVECYICTGVGEENSAKRKEEARLAILRHGGMVRDYIDDDINLILFIGPPSNTALSKLAALPQFAQIPAVYDDWLWNSLKQNLLLPYVGDGAIFLDP